MAGKCLRWSAWWLLFTGMWAVWGIGALCADDTPSNIELESSVYYTVKKGDTLWDISNRYFNTHWRWPQIWSENQQIMNPHRIFPGERLRLFHEVWEDSRTPEPPEASPPLPVVENRYYVYSPIHRIGFIAPQRLAVFGEIALVKGDRNLEKTILGQDETIYVRTSPAYLLQAGNVFSVYRPPTAVNDPETGELIGYQYYKTGLIRIIETRPEFAVAKIEKAFRSVMVDDVLLPYDAISPRIQLIPATTGVSGKIILAEENTEMLGDNAVAFINKGTQNGIQKGQTYAICEDYRIETMTLRTVTDTVDFGSFLVLHAEPTTATVLIVHLDRSIKLPENFRTQTLPGKL